jgi:hypothetical protein
LKIECKLVPRLEFEVLNLPDQEGKRKKLGRYHGSHFWDIEGYGAKAWVVMVDIVPENLQELVSDGHTIDEILEGCVNYLNELPIRKRKTKKKKKPLYGQLKPFRVEAREENGKSYLFAMLITDQRKNKHFWSEGNVVRGRYKRQS